MFTEFSQLVELEMVRLLTNTLFSDPRNVVVLDTMDDDVAVMVLDSL